MPILCFLTKFFFLSEKSINFLYFCQKICFRLNHHHFLGSVRCAGPSLVTLPTIGRLGGGSYFRRSRGVQDGLAQLTDPENGGDLIENKFFDKIRNNY